MTAKTKIDRARRTYERMEAALVDFGFALHDEQLSGIDKIFYAAKKSYWHVTPPGERAPYEVLDATVDMNLIRPHSRSQRPKFSIEVVWQKLHPAAEYEKLRGYFGIRGKPLNEAAKKLQERLFSGPSSPEQSVAPH